MPAQQLLPLLLVLGLCVTGCGDPDEAQPRSKLPPEGVPLGNPWSGVHDPGPLPLRVYIKTNTESFNRRYYFAAREGGIWLKPNFEEAGVDGDWEELTLPAELSGRVFEISADDNEMIAIDVERRIWTMTGALFEPAVFAWKLDWGMPFWTGPGHSLPDWALRWEWSVISPQEDVYCWTRPAIVKPSARPRCLTSGSCRPISSGSPTTTHGCLSTTATGCAARCRTDFAPKT
jgi:hypothetical protein